MAVRAARAINLRPPRLLLRVSSSFATLCPFISEALSLRLARILFRPSLFLSRSGLSSSPVFCFASRSSSLSPSSKPLSPHFNSFRLSALSPISPPHPSPAFPSPLHPLAPPTVPRAKPPASSPLYIVRLRSAPVAAQTLGIDGISFYGSSPDVAQTAEAATSVGAAMAAQLTGAAAAAGSLGGRLRRPRRFDAQSNVVRMLVRWLGQQQEQVARDVSLPASAVAHSYRYVTNGFAATLTAGQIRRLRNHPSVLSVRPSQRVYKASTDTPTFLRLPGSLWAEAGGQRSAGEGVVVGVVDTGIWPDHPSFADDGSYAAPPATWRGTCQTSKDFPRCNRKLIGARYFVSGFRQAYGRESLSADWLSARDADGHGTWCASAAAGNANVSVALARGQTAGLANGMAPRARVAMYKVFWSNYNSGGVTATWADIEAAVNRAVADGVDVLSLSLGGLDPSADYFDDLPYFYANAVNNGSRLSALVPSDLLLLWTKRCHSTTTSSPSPPSTTHPHHHSLPSLLLRPSSPLPLLPASQAGTVVVYAAGNEGPPPYSSSMYRTISNFSPFYLTVGASTISRRYLTNLTLADGTVLTLEGLGGGSVNTQNVGIVDSVLAKSSSVTNFKAVYCYGSSLDSAKVSGRILVCQYGGGATLETKIREAVARGARALLVTNVPESARYYLPYDSRLPMMYVDAAAAATIRTFIRSQTTPTASLAASYVTDPAAAVAPVTASFSSTGPVANPDVAVGATYPTNDVLKPDVIAPGVSLWGAWRDSSLATKTTARFNMISGTSMATPHIAGIAALLIQRNPSWTAPQVMSALMTTASTTNNLGIPISTSSGAPASPFDMGQGHVDPERLLDPGLTYPAAPAHYLNFLAGQNMTRARLLVSRNTSLNAIPAYNLNRPQISVSRLRGVVNVTRWVVNTATVVSNYTGEVVPPFGASVTLYPPSFTIEPGKTQVFTVELKATGVSSGFSFGSLTWKDELGHSVRSVIAVQQAPRFVLR
ncbi:unnamed protein product [Closterium sp. Naga37s-1]|nr:unnamed protein product [Closterium sp. Naga37s-1]